MSYYMCSWTYTKLIFEGIGLDSCLQTAGIGPIVMLCLLGSQGRVFRLRPAVSGSSASLCLLSFRSFAANRIRDTPVWALAVEQRRWGQYMANVDTGLIQVLCEYLEAFVHQVLYHRYLYAADLFSRHRLYGIAVKKARHPQLSAYIAQVVGSLKVRLI